MGSRSTKQALLIPPPAGLQAFRLRLRNEDCLVLSHPVRHWPLPDILTRSEREVVRAVLEGASRAEVARARGSSRHTVANIIASAFRKLGVNSRLELASRLASSSETPS